MELVRHSVVGNVHLLSDSWKLWYWRVDVPAAAPPVNLSIWLKNLHGLCEFDSVEKFWSIFNHIKIPSMLNIGCDYSVFKSDIKPVWEDETNKKGGRWLIKDNGFLDQYWMDILLSMIGGMYEPYNNNICGIVYNRRQFNKLSLWISTCDTNIVNDIGLKLKNCINTKDKIIFEKHWEISKKKKNILHKRTTSLS
ncbi:Translation Initiation factor eIF-4e,Translation Initiation factor eIF- 4e-like,Eukaryotic [Cinara cedri]|uniref:eIF-4F 25 kDa subunit n=1 Tax=Cinara cedri TaxID=506608 RepID=A0A5E4N0M5_9HEMI|nr:Translation Initiation factor eIF-4e,Translation Initiation factor eIF- 4e-like,Eukaryotic [Cinara cedri]